MKYFFMMLVVVSCCYCNNSPAVNDDKGSVNKITDTALEKKKVAGVDFVALGNEPYWSLEIDLESVMRFSTSEEGVKAVSVAVPAPVKSSDDNIITYEAHIESGIFIVTIVNQPCTDNMSAEVYPYTVTVQANGKLYSGCGQYLN